MLVEPYMDLDKPIIAELKRQGHHVTVIADRQLDFDWRQAWRGKRDRLWTKLKAQVKQSYKRYWDAVPITESFDMLIVINGCSFHKSLLERLKAVNPNIRTRLYLWDNSQFYDYYCNAKYFDKVKTYDLADSVKYGAELLPFYWCPVEQNVTCDIDIFMLGTNHSNRLSICRKIRWDLPDSIKTYFKILDMSIPEDDIVIHQSISPKEATEIMSHSRCVLDTDRESQTGTTPRLIWAVALGKKIITTNQNVRKMPFYNEQQFLVIDRNNPQIPLDFVTRDLPTDFKTPNIESLRIDNWVKTLIS